MAEYECVAKGSLNLKTTSDSAIKKKKKREKQKALEQQIQNAVHESGPVEAVNAPQVLPRTKAQLAHDKMQQKRQMQRIVEKASKTHKQRVEEFNNHLDKLTEHYDIPKVSWTK